jgi:hypothetical protein
MSGLICMAVPALDVEQPIQPLSKRYSNRDGFDHCPTRRSHDVSLYQPATYGSRDGREWSHPTRRRCWGMRWRGQETGIRVRA